MKKPISMLELGAGPYGGMTYRIARMRKKAFVQGKRPGFGSESEGRLVASDVGKIEPPIVFGLANVKGLETRKIEAYKHLRELIEHGEKVKVVKADYLLDNLKTDGEKKRLLRAVREVLAPNGRLFITAHKGNSAGIRKIMRGLGYVTHKKCFRPSSLSPG
ncbi:MAG: hypothetical protein ABH854_05015 [Candidatus Diapherotrites archaeon]